MFKNEIVSAALFAGACLGFLLIMNSRAVAREAERAHRAQTVRACAARLSLAGGVPYDSALVLSYTIDKRPCWWWLASDTTAR